MKNYLEIIELLSEEEQFIKQPQIIRIEVIDKNDALEKVVLYESLFQGLNYKKQLQFAAYFDGYF